MAPKTAGAYWKALSCLCFAVINVLIKQVSLPPFQLACLENLFGCGFLWLLFGRTPKRLLKEKVCLFRTGTALVGVILWITSLQKLPIAQTVALGFLGPFFTTIGAHFFLGESLGRQRLAALALGTLGGLTIAHGPHLSLINLSFDHSLWLPITSTIAFALCTLFSKFLTRRESAEDLAFTLMLHIGLALIPTIFLWQIPSPTQMLLVALLGLLYACAHVSMGKAFTCSDVTFLLPIGSLRFIFSSLLGWYCYHEVPSLWTLAGMGVIMIGLWILSKDRPT